MSRNLIAVASCLACITASDVLWGAEPPAGRPHPDVERAVVSTVATTSKGAALDELRERPIGVFDSGTGGLTVLERILQVDEYDNSTGKPGSDGLPDFRRESFVFLADQANMPYGNYPVVHKETVLDDLIVKDAQFLLGTSFHAASTNPQPVKGKAPAKVLVIACNTATAFGLEDIERAIRQAESDVAVIGVIDAGAKGALEVFADGKPGSIGVVPTQGTVLSGAYPRAIRRLAAEQDLRQRIDVFQQGAFGLAGAIDGAAEFIEPGVIDHTIRAAHRGPSMTNKEALIDPELMERYGFDFTDNHMLYAGDRNAPRELQLNSAENYLKYHLVTLLEQIRSAKDAEPLRAVVMGCTHFPFYLETFRSELDRLYDHREDGLYVYRDLMSQDVELVDPAVYTARELYTSLRNDGKLRTRDASENGVTRSEFFITVPCRVCTGVKTDATGAFTYDYKYGRSAGMVESDYLTVPLREGVLPKDAEERLRTRIPHVWKTLDEFRRRNAKAQLEAKP